MIQLAENLEIEVRQANIIRQLITSAMFWHSCQISPNFITQQFNINYQIFKLIAHKFILQFKVKNQKKNGDKTP